MASLDRQKRHSHKFWIEVDVVRLLRAIQASLTGRGSVSFLGPGVETPGYRQSSLRDGCAYPASAAPTDLRASRRPSRRCMPNGYTPARSPGGTLKIARQFTGGSVTRSLTASWRDAWNLTTPRLGICDK